MRPGWQDRGSSQEGPTSLHTCSGDRDVAGFDAAHLHGPSCALEVQRSLIDSLHLNVSCTQGSMHR